MRNPPRMEKKIAENSAPFLAEGLQLENRLKIARPPHGALGFNQSIKGKYPYLKPGKPDHLTQGQAFMKSSKSLDFSEAVELSPLGAEIKVFEPPLLGLLESERQPLWSHAMARLQSAEGSKNSNHICGIHGTNYIDIPCQK